MKISAWLRRLAVRRRLRKEQALRERCIRYAGGNGCNAAAAIYRFIANGTYIYCNPHTKQRDEYVYSNLEGVIHRDGSQEK